MLGLQSFARLTFYSRSSIIRPFDCLPRRSVKYKIKVRNTDPPYLSYKPPIPIYEELQFDLKCHDFVVLERFCSYLGRFLQNMDLAITNFPLPPKQTLYRVYHPNSTKTRTEFELSLYHRVCRVQKMKAVDLPVLMDLFYQNLPGGLELSVGKVDPESDEARYVPQLEVEALQGELAKLQT